MLYWGLFTIHFDGLRTLDPILNTLFESWRELAEVNEEIPLYVYVGLREFVAKENVYSITSES